LITVSVDNSKFEVDDFILAITTSSPSPASIRASTDSLLSVSAATGFDKANANANDVSAILNFIVSPVEN
jgi:hypothetical protein